MDGTSHKLKKQSSSEEEGIETQAENCVEVLKATIAESPKSFTEENLQKLQSTLRVLWTVAKHNDAIKLFIGDSIGYDLVTLCSGSLSIEAAQLLRRITLADQNKLLLLPVAIELLDKIRTTPASDVPLLIELTAIIWNISSKAELRTPLISQGVLDILAEFTLVAGGLQVEAFGAIRNLTLDNSNLAAFAKTKVIENLMSVLPTLDGPRLVSVLNALRNLSVEVLNHPKILPGIPNLLRVDPLSDSHKYVTQILSNLDKHEANKAALQDPLCQAILHKPTIPSHASTQIQNFLATEDDLINVEDVSLEKVIGKGTFATVYYAHVNGFGVACKVVEAELSDKNALKILDEVRLMRQLKHPNILLMMGACLNRYNQIMIVTEFAARGDLSKCLEDFTSIVRRVLAVQDLLTGMAWLQLYKIVHRDLKLQNLLVANDYTIKVCDFGLSITLDGKSHQFGGNVKYSAPEILERRFSETPDTQTPFPYSEKTDVYSFGLLWHLILTKEDSFKSRPEKFKSREGIASYIIEGNRPSFPHDWPKSLKNRIGDCWSQDPQVRPPFRQILAQWDSITLDFLCPDAHARHICYNLWRDQKNKIYFHVFLKALVVECMPFKSMKEKYAITLFSLFVDDLDEETVSFSRFCFGVGWFGPLDQNLKGFLKRMKDLTERKCFHGLSSNRQIESKLTHLWRSTSEKRPYHLVRYSTDEIGLFSLCFIDSAEHRIQTLKIKNVNGQLGCEGVFYQNWKQLKHGVKKEYMIGKHVPVNTHFMDTYL